MTADGLAASPLEVRLRKALAGTAESPRPVADLELPSELVAFTAPDAVARLRPAAVLVPVLGGDEPRVVLTRRADHLRKHGGQISFPGGARDDGDASAAAAALRESREEIGLSPDDVEVIGYLDDYPTGTGFRVTPVVGLVSGAPSLNPAEDEVAEVFDVPLAWLLDIDRYQRRTFERDGLVLPFYEIHYGERRIWGATAGMLYHLCQRLAAHRV